MKTKTIILGVVVAAISTFTISRSRAQSQEPSVKIVPAKDQDMIKVIYAHNSSNSVSVKFIDQYGTVKIDRIDAKDFSGGFLKKYNVEQLRGSAFWVEVGNLELSYTYKMVPAKNGKWSAQLEKTTYNHPIVALK